ncbi:hypothetical protein M422DRAFT_273664 [Sphaerobolus stellatus SS14]|uniref:DUF6533 domain-containing protein n=1 Tax=Sphaerobolus stellatus (strain SS14) TaxID=990650 RepID=A0A0C9TU65_SPHS4|nr:hypothetical protein M422DRAFT_273664 [Sphaerobolus stellatus SS14]
MPNSPSLPSPFRQPRAFYEYCIMLAALTACLYDHALTFDSELRHIWAHKLNLFTSIWLLLRYFTPLSLVFETIAAFNPNWNRSSYGLSDVPVSHWPK